jgi:phosphoribosylaminoimidazole-succinocarboxamide synthase
MVSKPELGRRNLMSFDVVLDTSLPFPSFKKGKVRDVYDLGERLLIVSTDRISAFDVVLPSGIPRKGEALNRLSAYWFNETRDIVPNHVIEVVDPRTVLVRKTRLLEVEFVVRGYLYGGAWESYRKGKTICGKSLPTGLRKAERLPAPILTPTTKEESGHDKEITRAQVAKEIGSDLTEEVYEVCLKVYDRASKKAEANGIIVADTKMEFGILNDELVLIDELLTPDSSRFWPKDRYEIGKDQLSFDKQYVRDYLTSIGWNREPPAPRLPEQVILETSRKYIEAYERLTGRKF